MTMTELKTFKLNSQESLSAFIEAEIKSTMEMTKDLCGNELGHYGAWDYISTLAEMNADNHSYVGGYRYSDRYIGADPIYGKLFYLICVCIEISFGDYGYTCEWLADGVDIHIDQVDTEVEKMQSFFNHYKNNCVGKNAIQQEILSIDMDNKNYSSDGVIQLSLYSKQLHELLKISDEDDANDKIVEFLQEWGKQDVSPIVAQAYLFFSHYYVE